MHPICRNHRLIDLIQTIITTLYHLLGLVDIKLKPSYSFTSQRENELPLVHPWGEILRSPCISQLLSWAQYLLIVFTSVLRKLSWDDVMETPVQLALLSMEGMRCERGNLKTGGWRQEENQASWVGSKQGQWAKECLKIRCLKIKGAGIGTKERAKARCSLLNSSGSWGIQVFPNENADINEVTWQWYNGQRTWDTKLSQPGSWLKVYKRAAG